MRAIACREEKRSPVREAPATRRACTSGSTACAMASASADAERAAHEDAVGPARHDLGEPAHRRRHDRDAESEGFHHRHRQAFVVRREDEEVGRSDETGRIVPVPEQRETLTEAAPAPQLPDLRLQWPLTCGREAHQRAVLADEARRFDEPGVVLVVAEVGDGHRERLARQDAELLSSSVRDLGDGRAPRRRRRHGSPPRRGSGTAERWSRARPPTLRTRRRSVRTSAGWRAWSRSGTTATGCARCTRTRAGGPSAAP